MSAEEIRNMTLEDLAALPDRTVGTAIIAHFLEMDRWNVTLAAKAGQLPRILQEHSHFSGNRLHVVKKSLLEYLGYEGGGFGREGGEQAAMRHEAATHEEEKPAGPVWIPGKWARGKTA